MSRDNLEKRVSGLEARGPVGWACRRPSSTIPEVDAIWARHVAEHGGPWANDFSLILTELGIAYMLAKTEGPQHQEKVDHYRGLAIAVGTAELGSAEEAEKGIAEWLQQLNYYMPVLLGEAARSE